MQFKFDLVDFTASRFKHIKTELSLQLRKLESHWFRAEEKSDLEKRIGFMHRSVRDMLDSIISVCSELSEMGFRLQYAGDNRLRVGDSKEKKMTLTELYAEAEYTLNVASVLTSEAQIRRDYKFRVKPENLDDILLPGETY